MGGAAARLAARPDLELFTTTHTFDETLEYLPVLAAHKGLRLERMERALQTVPIRIVPADEFASSRDEAARRMAQRDPEDVDLLALAMHLGLTVWTNDRDFAIAGLSVVSTAQLLALIP
ncbi:MAG: PIN domain-containing protein [Acidobacteria bacterium]|nr:PIN domain-containing protein [Acidobacteriota bacterium]